jgi:hypothetical protein
MKKGVMISVLSFPNDFIGNPVFVILTGYGFPLARE